MPTVLVLHGLNIFRKQPTLANVFRVLNCLSSLFLPLLRLFLCVRAQFVHKICFSAARLINFFHKIFFFPGGNLKMKSPKRRTQEKAAHKLRRNRVQLASNSTVVIQSLPRASDLPFVSGFSLVRYDVSFRFFFQLIYCHFAVNVQQRTTKSSCRPSIFILIYFQFTFSFVLTELYFVGPKFVRPMQHSPHDS